jgi:hypothetical protein
MQFSVEADGVGDQPRGGGSGGANFKEGGASADTMRYRRRD